MTEDERLAEIQRRIDECRRTRSIELDLRYLITNEVPEEVFELDWLENLNISNYVPEFGKLKGLPSLLKYLSCLKELKCNGHNLADLSFLTYVPQLQILECALNQLSTLQGLENLPQPNLGLHS